MEALLKFDMNDPDDRKDHLRCIKALSLAIACWELSYLWHEAENVEETEEYKRDIGAWWTKRISEILDDNGITEDLTN